MAHTGDTPTGDAVNQNPHGGDADLQATASGDSAAMPSEGEPSGAPSEGEQIGRASCRERV